MTAHVKAFGFPSGPSVRPPGPIVRFIARLQNASVFLSAALTGSILCNIGLGLLVLRTADAQAYVTDGSLYGCRVQEHDAPAPAASAPSTRNDDPDTYGAGD